VLKTTGLQGTERNITAYGCFSRYSRGLRLSEKYLRKRRRSYVLRGTSNGLRQTERLKLRLRLLRTNCVGRDYLDKLRGSGFRFQWITGHLTEQAGIDRPCAGNGGPYISFYCRPIAFKVSSCLHVDLFCDRLQTRFVLNGQTDGVLGMFKAFIASRNAKRSQDVLHGCHWYILPNPET